MMAWAIRLGMRSSGCCSSPKSMRGMPGWDAINSAWNRNSPSREARGEQAAEVASSDREIRRWATQSMAACKMASLLGKWRKIAPWVSPMRWAMAAVVISLGFCSPAREIIVSTVRARRFSAGRFFFVWFMGSSKKDSYWSLSYFPRDLPSTGKRADSRRRRPGPVGGKTPGRGARFSGFCRPSWGPSSCLSP